MEAVMEPFEEAGRETFLIPQIFFYMNYEDLKSMRSVSRRWCKLVSEHKLFNLNRSTILHTHLKSIKTVPSLPWKNVELIKYIENGKGNLLTKIWPKMGGTIAKLNLYKVEINCDQMCRVLNNTPVLEVVLFDDVKFNKDLDQVAANKRTIFTYCIHNTPAMQNEEYEKFTKSLVPAPSLKKVGIQNQPAFPICVMDNLITRSCGTLVDLSIRQSPVRSRARINSTYNPSMSFLRPKILQLMRGSTSCLKRVEFYNNFGFNMFQYALENTNRNEFKITELVFGSVIPLIENPNSFAYGLEETDYIDTERTAMLGLVSHLSPLTLESLTLHLTFVRIEGQRAVTQMLGQLLRLQKLQVGFFNSINWIRIEIPETCQLSELLLYTNAQGLANRNQLELERRRPIYFWPEILKTLNLQNLNSLSIATNLTISQNANLPQQYQQLFETRNLGALRKLCFWRGENVTDGILQSIITRIPQLEELTICDSVKLTESGITGLTNASRELIASCIKNGQPYPDQMEQSGHCLRELQNLKYLNLSGCRRITDLCLHYAFRFPGLKELNLHNCILVLFQGIGALAKNVPSLEILTVPHGICNPGEISAFIRASRSVKTINLSHKLVYASDPNAQNPAPINPNFFDIVNIQEEKKTMDIKFKELIR